MIIMSCTEKSLFVLIMKKDSEPLRLSFSNLLILQIMDAPAS